MNNCIVLYDGWQMQCCGVPFKIGDTVKWIVLEWNSEIIPVNVGTIHYCYEAHSSDYENLFILSGVVTEIRALHYKYENSPNNPKLLIPVSGLTVNVDKAEGWDEPFEGLPFSAYIINIDEVYIRKTEKTEVTFK